MGLMPGTTPTHILNIKNDFDTSIIQSFKITYKQNDRVVLTKRSNTEDYCILSGKEIITKLTQQDTFLFNPEYLVKIQVRALTKGGELIASKVRTISVDECLDNEVLL